MKKVLILAFAALIFSTNTFAKIFTIDIADSINGKNLTIRKDVYADDYKAYPSIDVTPFFAEKPQPGDYIEVFYNFTSDSSIDYLGMIVIDTSLEANYWTEITKDYTKGIPAITAWRQTKGSITFAVTAAPIKNIAVVLYTTEPGIKKLTLYPAGAKTGQVNWTLKKST